MTSRSYTPITITQTVDSIVPPPVRRRKKEKKLRKKKPLIILDDKNSFTPIQNNDVNLQQLHPSNFNKWKPTINVDLIEKDAKNNPGGGRKTRKKKRR